MKFNEVNDANEANSQRNSAKKQTIANETPKSTTPMKFAEANESQRSPT
jgi:hypothetical protein